MKYQDDPIPIGKYKNKQGGKIPVVQIDLNDNRMNVFESATEAGRIIGTSSSIIAKCCKGKAKTCRGYRWEYLDDKTEKEELNVKLCKSNAI